jgi:hypothetical protein
MNTIRLKLLVLGTTAMLGSTLAQAAEVSTISFSDIGSGAYNPGPYPSNGTSFTSGDLINNSDGTGLFAGLETQLFGSESFAVATGTSFSFGNATFGSFTSTSITLDSSSDTSATYDILGDYSSGSFDGGQEVNDPASFVITFTSDGDTISDSATFSIPAVEPTPEPTTLALLGVGMGGVWVRLRRRAA